MYHLIVLAHLALSSTPTPTVEAHETTIEATWTCGAPKPLASDTRATVRDCRWVVR